MACVLLCVDFVLLYFVPVTVSCRFWKVVAESEEVYGSGASLTGPLPSSEALRGLQLTEACLREALRKYRCLRVCTRVHQTQIRNDA